MDDHVSKLLKLGTTLRDQRGTDVISSEAGTEKRA